MENTAAYNNPTTAGNALQTATGKARLAALMLFCLAALSCSAQNSIDRLVENFSALGSAKFTSVVDRDPATRKVQKVVKVLELRGTQAGKFRKAFQRESTTGNYTERRDEDGQTLALTCESVPEVRLYMLREEGRPTPRKAKVTIIVRRKH